MDLPNPYALNTDVLAAQEAERSFLARVYRWMAGGLALSAAVAFYAVSSPSLLHFVGHNYWLLAIGEIGLVIALSFLAPRLSGAVAGACFAAYAALNGLTFSLLFLVYQLGSIANVFFACALAFGALSIYGTRTKRDLSAWRAFLYIGLFGLIGAGLVNLFVHSEGLSFVASCAGVLVFAGLTAYDTQKLKRMHAVAEGQQSLHVVGALILYLDFVNLFLSLLRLFGRRR
jgi:uncharacterized protein